MDKVTLLANQDYRYQARRPVQKENAMTPNLRKWMIALSLFAACTLIAVPAIAQSKPAPGPPPQNVVVVNGAGQPVPTAAQGTTNVAGTVNVGNTPNVNVANTPTVTLSSGASVNVISPLDGSGNPIPIATLEAVQVYGAACAFPFSGAQSGHCEFTPIPQGKQLVIQEFDARGQVEAGNRPYEIYLYNTITVANLFPYTFMLSDSGFDYLATHQETRVYVSPGATPVCDVELLHTSNGGYHCDISGFLVDVH